MFTPESFSSFTCAGRAYAISLAFISSSGSVDHPMPLPNYFADAPLKLDSGRFSVAPTDSRPVRVLFESERLSSAKLDREKLWKHLSELRSKAIANGLQLLSADEISAEVARRRGEL